MLTQQQLAQVTDAIRNAETLTSGEIRVCVAKTCKGNPLEAVVKKFHELKMENTQLRNGVLIYVSPSDHKAAIFGDKGISEAARDDFWNDTLDEMFSYFKEGHIVEGIICGVGKVGELIKVCYPVSETDVNELSDDVILEE